MIKARVIYFLGMLLIASAQKCSISTQDQNLVQTLSTGNLDFTFNLYKSLPVDKNVFISPFSISVALAMTAIGAGGRTLSQMKDGLMLNQLSTDQNINQAYSAVLNSICSNSNYTLTTANKIYVQDAFPILSSYKSTLLNSYRADAQNVDFLGNSDGVALEINGWVEKQTSNHIKDLFPPGSLNPLTVAVIINAIYFKGVFQTQFEVKSTFLEEFFPTNLFSVLKVPTMHMTSSLNYTENQQLACKMLQLNYAGDRLALYIILPNEDNGLSRIKQSLTSSAFNSLRRQLKVETVAVSLPKFNINFKQEFKSTLERLRMVDMFDETRANFSRMTNSQLGLYVSQVLHQAFVAVDEKGTTAAAVTAVTLVTRSGSRDLPKQFKADHPFILVIYDSLTNMVLFMGNVNDPSK